MGLFNLLLAGGSHPHLASLYSIQPIQARAVCATGVVLIIVALSIGIDIFLYSRPEAFSVIEIVTPNVKYCTSSFNIGPMPAIYASIPIICYDIFLVVLAAVILVRHLREGSSGLSFLRIYVLSGVSKELTTSVDALADLLRRGH
ncbi:hypothetical protein EDB19DRAFT_915915 [Suillus lakei]|nr:hypothetical protein EDB19DRAFT_915915 [Suillus lakei]